MSMIKNNPIMKGASGMLGDVVVYREVRGKLIMSNRPKGGRILTPQQEEAKSKFLRAVKYAKKQMTDPILKAQYVVGAQSRFPSAYAAAMGDYLSAPKIHNIDTSRYGGVIGDELIIHASDNFKIIMVHVALFDAGAILIEQGNAVPDDDAIDEYVYTATAANAVLPRTKVVVTVRDRPGNITVDKKVV